MRTKVYVLNHSYGLIPDVRLHFSRHEFIQDFKSVLGEADAWFTDISGDAEDRWPVVKGDPWDNYTDPPEFLTDLDDHEIRWYSLDTTNVTRSHVHSATEEYDPEVHGYVCPEGVAACPCGVYKDEENDR